MLDTYTKDTRIGVIAGGFSGEREVSLRSGKNVLAALQRKGYNAKLVDPAHIDMSQDQIDVAFLVLHGQFGEDGCIQAYLSHLGIPYTGSGTEASILGMNKLMTKTIMQSHGLPTPAFQVITTPTFDVPWAFPIIVKPISEGSSLGVIIADTMDQCRIAVTDILAKYGICLIEEYIEGRELTIGVLDHKGQLQALPILELKPENRFYDFDAKYTPGKTTFVLPAPFPEATRDMLQAHALRLHEALGCAGATRTDMLFHETRGAFLLEINTAPGMTDQSDLPAQAAEAGISFDDLVERILCSASLKK